MSYSVIPHEDLPAKATGMDLDPRFRSAIADYLRREARNVDEYAEAARRHVPYKELPALTAPSAELPLPVE